MASRDLYIITDDRAAYQQARTVVSRNVSHTTLMSFIRYVLRVCCYEISYQLRVITYISAFRYGRDVTVRASPKRLRQTGASSSGGENAERRKPFVWHSSIRSPEYGIGDPTCTLSVFDIEDFLQRQTRHPPEVVPAWDRYGMFIMHVLRV